ncbi:LuxR family transcriptional regulator [Salipiger sp. IMCC34102]|uniref:helix-turn-helix transcriptional regulator n=1 Tax=Salipiger sp. IMCC34102 TaxID=2510647 RepID=UPI00101CB7B3|nr:LuxR family transcriptional regulator [Salipiger sp. IMCC34102]RYH04567.1 LuxR family transcriptional regulator [Salipiger sp. IMCC34102]
MGQSAVSVLTEAFLAELEVASDLDDFQALVPYLRETLKVDHVVYHWVSVDGGQLGFGTYDNAWVQRYSDRDYVRIDPVVQCSFRSFEPLDWKTIDWSSKPARDLREDAIRHGVGNQGLTVPIRGPAGQFSLLTVSSNCDDATWDDFISAYKGELVLLAHHINVHVLRVHAERVPDPSALLSPRELDALSYLGMGYGRAQAADLMSISEHTLRSYIEGARRKLGAQNTTQAVARAVAEGLILSGGSPRGSNPDWPGLRRAPGTKDLSD